MKVVCNLYIPVLRTCRFLQPVSPSLSPPGRLQDALRSDGLLLLENTFLSVLNLTSTAKFMGAGTVRTDRVRPFVIRYSTCLGSESRPPPSALIMLALHLIKSVDQDQHPPKVAFGKQELHPHSRDGRMGLVVGGRWSTSGHAHHRRPAGFRDSSPDASGGMLLLRK